MGKGSLAHTTREGERAIRTPPRRSRTFVLVSILLLAGCATTQISPDAGQYGLAGLPCVDDRCARPPSCPAPLASSADLCALWQQLVKTNDRSLNEPRVSYTWTRDPEKPRPSEWSPAKDRGPRTPHTVKIKLWEK